MVSALGTFDSFYNSCSPETCKYLFQILWRYLIPLGNTAQHNMFITGIYRQINQCSESISAFFRKFHKSPPHFYRAAINVCLPVSDLLYCFKSFLQILNNIIDIFCSDGKTNGIWLNTLIQQFFLCALAVCSRSRMNNQRFYIGNICQK